MSVQAVVPFTINGEKYFTHTSWFSERQYNGWTYIPAENSNLAFYYSLSVVSLACIVKYSICSSSEKQHLFAQPSLVMAKSLLELEEHSHSTMEAGSQFLDLRRAVKSTDLSQRMNADQLHFGKMKAKWSICETKTIQPSWADVMVGNYE